MQTQLRHLKTCLWFGRLNQLEYTLPEVFNLTSVERYEHLHHKVLDGSCYPVITCVSHHGSDHKSPWQSNKLSFCCILDALHPTDKNERAFLTYPAFELYYFPMIPWEKVHNHELFEWESKSFSNLVHKTVSALDIKEWEQRLIKVKMQKLSD